MFNLERRKPDYLCTPTELGMRDLLARKMARRVGDVKIVPHGDQGWKTRCTWWVRQNAACEAWMLTQRRKTIGV